MNKYINADKLTEYLADDCFTWRGLNEDRADEVDSVIKAIAEMPAADVVEVKHGEWAKSGQSFLHPEKFVSYCCSECGYEDTEKIKYNFCPNCGADMRGRAK